MQIPEYGPLFPGVHSPSPEILAVTDLGAGNIGAISAAGLVGQEREQLIQDVGKAKYHLPPTNRFRCVDGRTVEGGLITLPGHADPQLAAGLGMSETASGMLVVEKQVKPISELLAANTRLAIINGVIVVVHGDDVHGLEGCGGNAKMHDAIGLAAEVGNHDILADKAWTLARGLKLYRLGVVKDDIHEQLRNADRNANDDSLWDTTASENIEISLTAGAEYEEVIDEHSEVVVVPGVSETAFDEESFMRDHPGPDGTSREAFVASLGAYTRWKLEVARNQRLNMRQTALGIMGVVIYNLAVPKVLTAEEQGNGEALPVVVIG